MTLFVRVHSTLLELLTEEAANAGTSIEEYIVILLEHWAVDQRSRQAPERRRDSAA